LLSICCVLFEALSYSPCYPYAPCFPSDTYQASFVVWQALRVVARVHGFYCYLDTFGICWVKLTPVTSWIMLLEIITISCYN
jgi:hypothetical protein